MTIAGRDNTVSMPIYLLPLDLEGGLYVDETRGGILTLPAIPGFALEIRDLSTPVRRSEVNN